MQTDACNYDNSACLHFLIMSPDTDFYFISGLYLSNHVKYFNDTLYGSYMSRWGSYARIKTDCLHFLQAFSKQRRAYAVPPLSEYMLALVSALASSSVTDQVIQC